MGPVPAPRSRAAEPWTAVLLAGERPGDPLAAYAHAPCKALVEVDGLPMVERVASVLLRSPRFDRLIILSQRPEMLEHDGPSWLAGDPRVSLARSTDGISDSVRQVIEDRRTHCPVLVTTADHALLTGQMLDEFIDGAEGADVGIGVVERDRLMRAYPESHRTWLTFSDGGFTGANLFALRNRRISGLLGFWSRAERNRKDTLKLFWQFGPRLFARALTRTISLPRALERAGRSFGLRIKPVKLTIAEAGIDVDKPEDLELAERILRHRRAAQPSL
jgi:2-C-methyl-D-erythritol 4-phosphate cytidylyltransferase